MSGEQGLLALVVGALSGGFSVASGQQAPDTNGRLDQRAARKAIGHTPPPAATQPPPQSKRHAPGANGAHLQSRWRTRSASMRKPGARKQQVVAREQRRPPQRMGVAKRAAMVAGTLTGGFSVASAGPSSALFASENRVPPTQEDMAFGVRPPKRARSSPRRVATLSPRTSLLWRLRELREGHAASLSSPSASSSSAEEDDDKPPRRADSWTDGLVADRHTRPRSDSWAESLAAQDAGTPPGKKFNVGSWAESLQWAAPPADGGRATAVPSPPACGPLPATPASSSAAERCAACAAAAEQSAALAAAMAQADALHAAQRHQECRVMLLGLQAQRRALAQSAPLLWRLGRACYGEAEAQAARAHGGGPVPPQAQQPSRPERAGEHEGKGAEVDEADWMMDSHCDSADDYASFASAESHDTGHGAQDASGASAGTQVLSDSEWGSDAEDGEEWRAEQEADLLYLDSVFTTKWVPRSRRLPMPPHLR